LFLLKLQVRAALPAIPASCKGSFQTVKTANGSPKCGKKVKQHHSARYENAVRSATIDDPT
jgi:hypothetical protein